MEIEITRKRTNDRLEGKFMSSKELNSSNRERELELLKIYYEEWKFRQENLWKRMRLFFVAIFLVSTLPITAYMFDGLKLPQVSAMIFPICGLVLSVFYIWYCLAESYRINAVDNLIKRIIRANYPIEYTKTDLVLLAHHTEKKILYKIFTWRMVIWIPVFLTFFEVIVAVAMLVLIGKGLIAG